MIRVVLPAHLKVLAGVGGEVELPGDGVVTLGAALDALEGRFPVLKGAIRDQATGKRRDFVRYYACQQDLSLAAPDATLPVAVSNGGEPLLIVGAMAGG